MSPDAFALMGNMAGRSGYLFAAGVLSAGVVFVYTAWIWASLAESFHRVPEESLPLRTGLGRLLSLFLPLVSRVVCAVCVSTSLAVTAGFVFNEVFLHWFPNFAFAFCLLVSVAVLNIAGRELAERAQSVFVTTVLTGISALVLLWVASPATVAPSPGEILPLSARTLVLAILPFVGFDLAFFVSGRDRACFRPLAFAVIAAAILYCAWGVVSLLAVPREALADSTVPHMLVARAVLGQEGRIIMGVVVIAGACSGMNALVAGVSRMLAAMAQQGFLPTSATIAAGRAHVTVLLITGGASVLMGLGFAGEPVLDVAIRLALLFWLLMYAAAHLAAVVWGGRGNSKFSEGFPAGSRVFSAACVMIFTGAFVWLLLTDEQSAQTLKFMGAASSVALVLCVVWIVMGRRSGRARG